MMSHMGSVDAPPAVARSATVVPTTLALPVTIMSAMLTYFVFMLQKCLDRRKDRALPALVGDRALTLTRRAGRPLNSYRVLPGDAKYWNGRGKCVITAGQAPPRHGEGGDNGCPVL